jgi:hypothetical protein
VSHKIRWLFVGGTVIVVGIALGATTLIANHFQDQTTTVHADANPNALNSITSFTQKGSDGKSVLDVLEESHQVETINQGSLGVYITSIDGKQSGPDGFWLFSINGQIGENTADKTITTNTQTIEWYYEPN